jgi:hypothetical protein
MRRLLPLARRLAANVEVLRPSIYAPVFCDRCAIYRARISQTEATILAARGRVLCRCGGDLTYVGPDFKEVIR